MGSIKSEKQSSSGMSEAMGGSQNMSRQGSDSLGSSYGMSSGSTDVWGAQQPALQQLYAQAAQLAGGQGPAGAGAQQVANQAQQAWLQQLTPGGNPYFERSVQGAIDQATQGFTRGVLPELEARGVALGQYGGARDNLARGEAAGLFGQGLSQQVGQMYANQYAGDQSRALGALGQAGAIQGMQTAPLTTAAGIIGGPTVLSEQQAINQSQNQASSWGESLGQAWNQASSSQSGRGSGSGVSLFGKG